MSIDKNTFTSAEDLAAFVAREGVDQLLRRMKPHVLRTAERRHNLMLETLASIQVDDLVSVGLDIVSKYYSGWDPSRGNFITYIDFYLKHRLTDFIRHQSVHTRRLLQLRSKIEAVRSDLMKTLGRNPCDYEIAEALGVTEETLLGWILEMESRVAISGDDEKVLETSDATHKSISNYERLWKELDLPSRRPENSAFVEAGFESAFMILGQAERRAFYGFFCLGLTLRQVGIGLDISESRLSQSMPSIVLIATREMGMKTLADVYETGQTLNYNPMVEKISGRWGKLSDETRHRLIEEYGLSGFVPFVAPEPEPTVARFAVDVRLRGARLKFGSSMATGENTFLISLKLRERELVS